MGRRVGPLLLLAALMAAGSASAQVTVNPGALDLLPAPATRPAPTRRPVVTPGRPAPVAPAPPPAPVVAAPPAAKPPVVPTIPPAITALPPPAPVPPPRPMPPPIVAVVADAPGVATPEPGGMRVTFGPERADLNPATETALRGLARGLRGNEQVTINVYAYAKGVAEDPSAARRLSLGRALAARAVLITEGIASTRIYPRALGPTGGDVDPDRVDVVAGPPAPPSAPAPTPGTPR